MIRITAKVDGFRRCGVAHRAAPTEYPDGRWSAAQLAILEAEPMLTVERVPEPQGELPGLGVPETQTKRRRR